MKRVHQTIRCEHFLGNIIQTTEKSQLTFSSPSTVSLPWGKTVYSPYISKWLSAPYLLMSSTLLENQQMVFQSPRSLVTPTPLTVHFKRTQKCQLPDL